MELKDQLITLEQAKQLKELWFEKESLYKFVQAWVVDDWELIELLDEYRIHIEWTAYYVFEEWKQYPAYTCAELMEYLPDMIPEIARSKLKIEKGEGLYDVLYEDEDWMVRIYSSNENLTQALWDMLIYLLTNKLM